MPASIRRAIQEAVASLGPAVRAHASRRSAAAASGRPMPRSSRRTSTPIATGITSRRSSTRASSRARQKDLAKRIFLKLGEAEAQGPRGRPGQDPLPRGRRGRFDRRHRRLGGRPRPAGRRSVRGQPGAAGPRLGQGGSRADALAGPGHGRAAPRRPAGRVDGRRRDDHADRGRDPHDRRRAVHVLPGADDRVDRPGRRHARSGPSRPISSASSSAPSTCPPASDRVWVLETNLDDLPGEVVGYTMTRLMDAGALDAFVTPIQMKKNRPGVMVSVLCDEAKIPALEDLLFRETTTLGIRRYPVSRHKLKRQAVEVETPFGHGPRQARLAGRPAADVQPRVRRLRPDRRRARDPAPRGLRRRPCGLCVAGGGPGSGRPEVRSLSGRNGTDSSSDSDSNDWS